MYPSSYQELFQFVLLPIVFNIARNLTMLAYLCKFALRDVKMHETGNWSITYISSHDSFIPSYIIKIWIVKCVLCS